MYSTKTMFGDHLRSFLRPASIRQSLRNTAYPLLALPTSMAYFTLLVSGLVLGFALLPLGIGLPILALVLSGSGRMLRFDHWLATHLLDLRSDAAQPAPSIEHTGWHGLAAYVRHPSHWRGVRYLLTRLPLDLAMLCIMLLCIASTVVLLGSPLLYRSVPLTVALFPLIQTGLVIDTLPEALICVGAGVLAAIGTLWVFNAIAGIYRQRAVRFFEAAR